MEAPTSTVRPHGRRPHRRFAPILVAVAVVLLASCGGDDQDEQREGTQPAPDVTSFEQGNFDDLPLMPTAEALGRRTEKDGVVSRTYEVRGSLPREVLDFYEDALPRQGWSPTGPVEDIGRSAFRGEWETEGWLVQVSSSPATGLDGDGDSNAVRSQYSLVLEPV